MSRKILCAALLLMASISGISAQKIKEGSLDFLQSETKINVVVDYSKSKIDGLLYEDWLRKEGKGRQNWEEKGQNEVLWKFLASINKQISKKYDNLNFGEYPEVKYTAIIYILKINDDCDFDAEVVFSDIKSDNIVAKTNLHGKAGHFGSFTNLLGDAMINAGKKYGKFILKFLE
jgi:hypothetical protein